MIVGTGLDVVEIARIERALERRGERFARRLFGEAELAGLATARRPAALLAVRFAAKEAVLKALGTGLAQGVGWLDIRTAPGERPGSLEVELRGRAAELARERAGGRGVTAWLAVSRSRRHAVASVVLEAA